MFFYFTLFLSLSSHQTIAKCRLLLFADFCIALFYRWFCFDFAHSRQNYNNLYCIIGQSFLWIMFVLYTDWEAVWHCSLTLITRGERLMSIRLLINLIDLFFRQFFQFHNSLLYLDVILDVTLRKHQGIVWSDYCY